MQPGYRNDVIDARGTQILVGAFGDHAALAGDQRCGDRADPRCTAPGRPFNRGDDPVRQPVSPPVHPGHQFSIHAGRLSLRQNRPRYQVSDGADLQEKGLPGKVVAAGLRLHRRR